MGRYQPWDHLGHSQLYQDSVPLSAGWHQTQNHLGSGPAHLKVDINSGTTRALKPEILGPSSTYQWGALAPGSPEPPQVADVGLALATSGLVLALRPLQPARSRPGPPTSMPAPPWDRLGSGPTQQQANTSPETPSVPQPVMLGYSPTHQWALTSSR